MSRISDIQIPGYEVLSKLGEGGMGSVYKARQLSLDRLVAIKTLPPDLANDKESIKLLRHEARVEATLKHPNIVQVYEAGHVNDIHYFVMEYVEGESVSSLLERKGRLPESDCLVLAEVTAHALEHSWTRGGIIHGDLKPGNLFIDADGTVKLGDFLGLTLTKTDHATPFRDHVLGTLNYMSPEQVNGSRDLDARSDIYSLGLLLHHLVSGQLPFGNTGTGPEAEEVVLTTQLDDVSQLADVSVEMACLIEKLLVRDVNSRPRSWAEVLTDVARVRHGKLPAGPPPPPGASAMGRTPARAADLSRRPGPPTHVKTAATPERKRRSFFEPVALAALVGLLAVFFLIPPRPRPSPPELIPDELASASAIVAPGIAEEPVVPVQQEEKPREPKEETTRPGRPAEVADGRAPEPAGDPKAEARRKAQAEGLYAYTLLMHPVLGLVSQRNYDEASRRLTAWLAGHGDHVYAPEVRRNLERIEQVAAITDILDTRDYMLRDVSINTGTHRGTVDGIKNGQLNLKLTRVGDPAPVISMPLAQISTENIATLVAATGSGAELNTARWLIAGQGDPFVIARHLEALPPEEAKELKAWQHAWRAVAANYEAYRSLINVARILKSGGARDAKVAFQLATSEHRHTDVFRLRVRELKVLQQEIEKMEDVLPGTRPPAAKPARGNNGTSKKTSARTGPLLHKTPLCATRPPWRSPWRS